jgi:type I restriction enzyme R subunit
MDETTYAEEPALEWLQAQGWDYVYGPEIAPNGEAPERPGWYEVLLEDRMRAALVDLNPDVPRKAIEEAILRVREIASPEPIRDHLAFHELLVEGVPVAVLSDGEERAVRVRLVDFDDPSRNEFLAVNQFRIVIGQKNRRPDVLLFVNGLPLGQLELKDPGAAGATPVEAANQVAHYVETIPRLYRFVELVAVSDLLQARLGTISTPPEHFAEWKTMNPSESEGRTQLEVLIENVLEPARFLDPSATSSSSRSRARGSPRSSRSTTRWTPSGARSRRPQRQWRRTVARASSGTRRARARATRWSSTRGSSARTRASETRRSSR